MRGQHGLELRDRHQRPVPFTVAGLQFRGWRQGPRRVGLEQRPILVKGPVTGTHLIKGKALFRFDRRGNAVVPLAEADGGLKFIAVFFFDSPVRPHQNVEHVIRSEKGIPCKGVRVLQIDVPAAELPSASPEQPHRKRHARRHNPQHTRAVPVPPIAHTVSGRRRKALSVTQFVWVDVFPAGKTAVNSRSPTGKPHNQTALVMLNNAHRLDYLGAVGFKIVPPEPPVQNRTTGQKRCLTHSPAIRVWNSKRPQRIERTRMLANPNRVDNLSHAAEPIPQPPTG